MLCVLCACIARVTPERVMVCYVVTKIYEIKKSSKIGGLMLVSPRECYVFLREYQAVTQVTCYIHMGVSPIMPVEPKALCLLHTQPAQTGTHNTEPPQSRIEAL